MRPRGWGTTPALFWLTLGWLRVEFECNVIPSAFDDAKDFPSIASFRGSSLTPALGMMGSQLRKHVSFNKQKLWGMKS